MIGVGGGGGSAENKKLSNCLLYRKDERQNVTPVTLVIVPPQGQVGTTPRINTVTIYKVSLGQIRA